MVKHSGGFFNCAPQFLEKALLVALIFGYLDLSKLNSFGVLNDSGIIFLG
ncbi:hypothetical protein [Aequorivita marina]|nr:hypothetical protein [Aequorivita sp. S2608]MDS1297596.1 hypothetical protein [Aequorivita sp. S2608]